MRRGRRIESRNGGWAAAVHMGICMLDQGVGTFAKRKKIHQDMRDMILEVPVGLSDIHRNSKVGCQIYPSSPLVPFFRSKPDHLVENIKPTRIIKLPIPLGFLNPSSLFSTQVLE